MKNIVILISGRGSNFVAIAQAAIRENWKKDGLQVACVISNRPEAAGLAKAAEMGIPTKVVDHKLYGSREEFESALIDAIEPFQPAVIVLAGFMRILTSHFVGHYEGRILNIHPALLPLFRGLDTHARALEAGVRVHGCTVHFVSTELDGGAIIGQAVIPVLPGDSPETLAARGLKLEHVLYPRCVREVAAGRVTLHEERAAMSPETGARLVIFGNEI